MTYRLIGFSVFFVSMNVFVIGCSDTGGLRGADAAAGASTIVGGSQGTAGAAGGQTTAGGTGTVATGGQSASGGASEVAGGSGGQPSGVATGTLVITGFFIRCNLLGVHVPRGHRTNQPPSVPGS